MKHQKMPVLLGLLAAVLLIAGGCLVSGTFVLVETFSVSQISGFFGEAVDLTGNDIWEEHADKLDEIELIGFEVYMTNNATTAWKFWADMDQYDLGCTSEACANSSSTKFLIFDTLTIPAGTSTTSQKVVTYAQSLAHLKNVEQALAMVMSGQFNFYGHAQGAGTATVDSIVVIVTLNASDS